MFFEDDDDNFFEAPDPATEFAYLRDDDEDDWDDDDDDEWDEDYGQGYSRNSRRPRRFNADAW